MFPNANSTIYRNEDGEVLGWDNPGYFEPEYCDVCGVTHSSGRDCDSYDDDE